MSEIITEIVKLPPPALDVLRFFVENGNNPADEVDIIDNTDLSIRSFSKAIKRLVTKKFVSMDSNRFYTVTKKGLPLLEEVTKYQEEQKTRCE